MSFKSDLKNILVNDASLMSSIENIHYEHLDHNFDLTKNWIDYTFRISDQVNCLGGQKIMQNYEIILRVIVPDTDERNNISNYVIDLLSGNINGDIKDIRFVNSSPGEDLEKKTYFNTLSFDSVYVG